MILPSVVMNHPSLPGLPQAAGTVLPGQHQTDADVTDGQNAGYDTELAVLLMQLQPEAAAAEALPTTVSGQIGILELTIESAQNTTPEQTVLADAELHTLLLTTLPQQHSLLSGEYNPGLSTASATLMTDKATALVQTAVNLAEATPAEQLAKALVSTGAAGTTSLPGHGVFTQPTAILPLVSAVISQGVAATDSMTQSYIQNVLPAAAAPATLDVLASANTPDSAAITPDKMANLLSARVVHKTSAPEHPLAAQRTSAPEQSWVVQQLPQNQQVMLHSSLLNQTSLTTRVLNSQSALELTLLPLSPGSTAAATATQQGHYQWQSEPMPADPVRFGQRLLTLLSDKVDVQLGLGVNRATIRLDPPSLGSIELAVQFEGEKLTVQLNSSNSQLKEAMQQGLEQLRASLQLRLGGDAQIELRMGADAQFQQQHGRQARAQDEIAANIAGVEHEEDATAVTAGNTALVNQLV